MRDFNETRKNVNKATRRPLVLAACMMGMFMAAVEGTIVATAMPSIVGDLGGFSWFSWVFSIFLLTQAVSIPIYGKLADLYGRKPVYTVGAGLFLFGSLLCGFSQTMLQLIIFRAIQGIGAGAVQPIVTTIVGDIYTQEERAKIQGYLSSVWGISSVIGPVLGGVFVEYVHWAWVFWINLPVGLMSIAGIHLFLYEGVEKKKQTIDYLGSVFMLVAMTTLMLAIIQGGVAWSWFSLTSIFLLSFFVVGFALFLWQEQRFSEPMMPFHIWKHPVIGVANAASLTTGMLLMGVTTFLPAYVQGVMGYSAMVAGFSLAMMSIGWPLASMAAGRMMLKIGVRRTALLGGLFLLVGSFFLLALTESRGPVWAGAGSFFTGVGMGLTTTTFIISIQGSVVWEMRGVATASNLFMRTLGSTLGAAMLGGVLNLRLLAYLREEGEGLSFPAELDAVNILLNEQLRSQLTLEMFKVLKDGMSTALHTVYLLTGLLAVVSFILVTLLPKQDKPIK